ncbi:MAG TPA: hypothetical protein GX719_01540 [Gammaproteobacteria bacterium]|nr:hypothetical protein [Gammaproteobacteria bacterium]
MNQKGEKKQNLESEDERLAYEKAQSAVQPDDPLAAIKAMRLSQLAVCRLQSEKEMQAMRDQSECGDTEAKEE